MTRLLMLGAFFFCACSSDDDEPELTRGAFCEDWAEAACSEETVSRCQATGADACRVSQAAYCLDLVPAAFDPTRASDCISAVRSAYANGDLSAAELLTVQQLGTPCDRLVRGAAGEGESCDANADCATPDGFECVRKDGAVLGTCQQPEAVEPGRSCAAAQQVCSEGFYCDGANCIAHLALGADCASNVECGPEARCLAEQCTARLGTGEDCGAADDCVSGVCFEFAADDRRCIDRLALSPAEPFCDTLR